jgi:anti-sigma regulatory factor (Ser/Thr protein kinase)
MELESTPGSILITLNAYLEGLQRVLYNIGSHYFKKSRLDEELELIILDKELRNRFTELVLNIFGHPFGEARPATFFRYINRSKENDEEREFLTDFADLLKVKESLLGWCTFLTRIGEKSITRFISVNDEKNAIAVKTLYLIEFFNLGTYSLSGGENPMIFIRVNDPDKLDRLASNRYYNNRNVTKLYQRHLASNEVFNYFFTQISTSKERWDFIEGYFLGKDSNQDEDDRPMMQIKLVRPTGLNNGAYLSSLYWFLEEVYRLPEKADFKIDFSDIDFVVPSFILPVAVILAQQKQKEIQVKLLHSNGLKGYLQTIYFEEGGRQLSLEKSYKDVFETFTDKNYLGIFCVPATKDKLSLEFTESVLSHFKKTLITKLDLPMAVQSAVHYLVSEIFDNVIQHSGSEKFWIFAQYYPNKEYFDICIIDTGKGLLNSYLDNGYDEITTDIEAIEHAVNGYSTKEYYNERGKGMSTSRKMVVEGLDGDFIVISGNALFYNDKIIMAPVSWLGTIVSLRLPKFKSNFNYIMYIE